MERNYSLDQVADYMSMYLEAQDRGSVVERLSAFEEREISLIAADNARKLGLLLVRIENEVPEEVRNWVARKSPRYSLSKLQDLATSLG